VRTPLAEKKRKAAKPCVASFFRWGDLWRGATIPRDGTTVLPARKYTEGGTGMLEREGHGWKPQFNLRGGDRSSDDKNREKKKSEFFDDGRAEVNPERGTQGKKSFMKGLDAEHATYPRRKETADARSSGMVKRGIRSLLKEGGGGFP